MRELYMHGAYDVASVAQLNPRIPWSWLHYLPGSNGSGATLHHPEVLSHHFQRMRVCHYATTVRTMVQLRLVWTNLA